MIIQANRLSEGVQYRHERTLALDYIRA